MGVIILIAVIYSLFQIVYYIRHRYFKEIIVFIILISISVFYLIDFVKELKAPKPVDLLEFIFKPISRIVFDIEQ